MTDDRKDFVDQLALLQKRVVDAANGYDQAAKLSESTEMIKIFQHLAERHRSDADVIGDLLTSEGEESNEDGSWMTWVNQAIVQVRSIVGGLDRSAMEPLISGEETLIDMYKTAEDLAPEDTTQNALAVQRARLERGMDVLKAVVESDATA